MYLKFVDVIQILDSCQIIIHSINTFIYCLDLPKQSRSEDNFPTTEVGAGAGGLLFMIAAVIIVIVVLIRYVAYSTELVIKCLLKFIIVLFCACTIKRQCTELKK